MTECSLPSPKSQFFDFGRAVPRTRRVGALGASAVGDGLELLTPCLRPSSLRACHIEMKVALGTFNG